jgi:hypothetical protein
MDKTGFEREIGFGGFERLAAPSSPSRQDEVCRDGGRPLAAGGPQISNNALHH